MTYRLMGFLYPFHQRMVIRMIVILGNITEQAALRSRLKSHVIARYRNGIENEKIVNERPTDSRRFPIAECEDFARAASKATRLPDVAREPRPPKQSSSEGV
jgi:hypothetical protein